MGGGGGGGELQKYTCDIYIQCCSTVEFDFHYRRKSLSV